MAYPVSFAGTAFGTTTAPNAKAAKPAGYYDRLNPHLANIIPADAQRILELGCGEGILGSWLKEQDPRRHVTGLELVAEVAAQARENLDEVVVGDVEAMLPLPFGPSAFDCVTCGDVLEHLRDPGRVLRGLRDVLTPRGSVCVCVPNVAHWSVLAELLQGQFRYADNGLLDRTHVRFFTPNTFRELLIEAGFDVEFEGDIPFPNPDVTRVLATAASALGIDSRVTEAAATTYQRVFRARPRGATVSLTTSSAVAAVPAGMATEGTSVVILTYNSMATLAACLTSVLQNLGSNDEVIVVDNASTDGTAEFLRQIEQGPQFRVILNDANLGFSAGCNVGIREARGAYVCLLNPDTLVTPEWLPRMRRAFGHPRVAAVGPVSDAVAGFQQAPFHAPAGLTGNFSYDQFAALLAQHNDGQAMETKLLIGFCLMARRDVLLEVGLLDEELFLGCDDLDLSWRLRRAGYRLVIARDAFVHHECHVSFRTDASSESRNQRTIDLFAEKLEAHYGTGQVPSQMELWDIDWLQPKRNVFAPHEPVEGVSNSPLHAFVLKRAQDGGATSLIEILASGRGLPVLGGVRHVKVGPAGHVDAQGAELRDAALDDPAALPVEARELQGAVVVVNGLLDAVRHPESWVRWLADVAQRAVAVVVAGNDLRHLEDPSLPVLFRGRTRSRKSSAEADLEVAILDPIARLVREAAMPEVTPVAVLTSFNDADVIDPILDRAFAEGMAVHVVDNWSTDGTWERLEARRDELCGLERWPAEGPSAHFENLAILRHQEEVAARYPGRWVTLQASDEIRVSPFKGLTFAQGLEVARRAGANCVDLTIVDFRPVDDGYREGAPLEPAFGYFEWGQHAAHLLQHKTWIQGEAKVDIAQSGGHVVFFPGKRVFPYKSLLKHYSIRSQAHGERKVLRERKPRFSPQERAQFGWHTHYDDVSATTSFLRDPASLLRFDDGFAERYLLERISGVATVKGTDWLNPLDPKDWR